MGACYDQRILPGDLTKDQVRQRFTEIQCQDQWENGHSYSGTIGMAHGLEFRDQKFNSVREAEDWLNDHTEKWEAALAVRAKSMGKDVWVIGALCSS